MKKAILLLTVFVTLTCYGEKNQDTSSVNTMPFYWMFKFTTNKLLNTPKNLKQNNISLGAGIDIQYDLRLGDKGFGLSPGIGFEINSYNTNASFTTNNNGITEISIIPDTIRYESNSLSIMYINVPIEFQFITSPNKNNRTFGFGAGIKAGYLVHNSQKFITEQNNTEAISTETITTEKNLPNFSRLSYALTGRISYRRLKKKQKEFVGTSLSVIGSYGLSPIFESNKGSTLTSYQIGIGLAFIFK